jgi:hypothetical protein
MDLTRMVIQCINSSVKLIVASVMNLCRTRRADYELNVNFLFMYLEMPGEHRRFSEPQGKGSRIASCR